MKILILLFCALSISLYGQQEEILEYPAGKIAYQTFGDGFPVLIINGGPGMNSKGFEYLAKKLADNNRTIIYDQRGTGASVLNEHNLSNFSIDLMLEDIETLRKHLGYENWIVFGQSFGGMLAYAYAEKYPERVKAMVQSHSGGMALSNVSSFSVMNRLSIRERDSLLYFSSMLELDPGNGDLERKRAFYIAKAYVIGSEYENTIADRLMQVNMNLNSVLWADMRNNNFDKTAAMKEFQNKVLILHGLDDVVPVEVAESSHIILPDSRLVKMENCGHYGWLDRPDIYFPEVKKFLEENSPEL
ncbi:alpha/beta fold hydrolase [Christiangramia sabulilitoris]|uniref:Alpha/beta fold hydrolase n=1 Tax=Christiangramia sabulilitoris TaxID=2583991 RepID=A0A550I797_9FLAO|nr:alpha/beta fold hydrolase [Christiangramia sabulilitoris]TRO66854.1 alpha/beta fold hydrolase [Christiangramia sabulilitoris]